MTRERWLEDEQLWEAKVKTEINCSGSQIKQKKEDFTEEEALKLYGFAWRSSDHWSIVYTEAVKRKGWWSSVHSGGKERGQIGQVKTMFCKLFVQREEGQKLLGRMWSGDLCFLSGCETRRSWFRCCGNSEDTRNISLWGTEAETGWLRIADIMCMQGRLSEVQIITARSQALGVRIMRCVDGWPCLMDRIPSWVALHCLTLSPVPHGLFSVKPKICSVCA